MGIRPRSVNNGKSGLAALALVAGSAVGAVAAAPAPPSVAATDPSTCQLGNGVLHETAPVAPQLPCP